MGGDWIRGPYNTDDLRLAVHHTRVFKVDLKDFGPGPTENKKIEDKVEKISNHEDKINPFEQSINQTIASQSEKRKSHLEAFNHKFTHQFHKIDEMEKEPAYKRKGLDVNSDVQDSPSRLSLDKDNNDDLQIRSNNSFSQMPR